METKNSRKLGLADMAIALALGAVAAAVYFPGLADCVYPGESATLTSALKGLEPLPAARYPLAGFFYGLFGFSQALAPLAGVAAVMLAYLAVARYVRHNAGGEFTGGRQTAVSRLAGAVASALFLFSPAMCSAATHFEPRLLDVLWGLSTVAVLFAGLRLWKGLSWIVFPLAGAMCGMGAADTVSFILLLPLFVAGAWSVSTRRGGKGYGPAAVFLFSFLVAALWTIACSYGGGEGGALKLWLDGQSSVVKLWFAPRGAYAVPLFATLPFVLAVFSSVRAFKKGRTWVQLLFHALLSSVTLLAVSTPLSPVSIMGGTGYEPVLAALFVSVTAGYLVAYWWTVATAAPVINESLDETPGVVKFSRPAALAALGILALNLAISVAVGFFFASDRSASFADKVAERIVADMGGRTWLVTDPRVTGAPNDPVHLDTHIRLAAAKAGKTIRFIRLERDRDRAYVGSLAAELAESGVDARLCSRLKDYGILVFLQDWFESDPEIAKKVAVYGLPDIWRYAPGVEPVPELFFFGGDPSREAPSIETRREFASLLEAPDGWGSYGENVDWDSLGRLDLFRLSLRQHLSFVACMEGCRLHRKDPAGAFGLYEFVLREVDRDNVVAVFNELELASSGLKEAEARKADNERFLTAVAADERRRYDMRQLPLVYGTIMNRDMILKQGLGEADSGDRDIGLAQIGKAIEMMPEDAGDWLRLNVLAPRYVSGDVRERELARKEFDRTLESDPGNYSALVGTARLAMLDGDFERATALLEKAVSGNGDDPRVQLDLARLKLMRGDVEGSRKLAVAVTDAEPGNMAAWGLRAGIVFASLDALAGVKESVETNDRRDSLEKELSGIIVPAMERSDASSPILISVKADILRRKGGKDNLKAARALAENLVRKNPKNPLSGEMLLETMVGLEDRDAARRQAEEVLRSDPSSPLAHWVIGSLAMAEGDFDSAEASFRKAVSSKRVSIPALNDLAECLRRKGEFAEAEKFARRFVELAPDQYIAWETLGSIILESGDQAKFAEAEESIQKACNLSRGPGGPTDFRMIVSLARAKAMLGNKAAAKNLLDFAKKSLDSLDPQYRELYDSLRKEIK